MPVEELETDVLILGGGLAALSAAVAAGAAGARVMVAAKGIAARSGSTPISTAGIVGVIPAPGIDDSLEEFAQDLLASGQGIADPELARVVAAESGSRILELIGHGIDFVRVNGELERTRNGGHSAARSLQVDPQGHGARGLGMTLPLRAVAEARGARFLDLSPAVELLTSGSRVGGAVLVHRRGAGALLQVRAGAVIVATGGCGALYRRSTCPGDVTGDGLALALQAGAALRDMEFMQFYPTRLERPVQVLASERLSSDGAVLRNRHGHAFMADYHPAANRAPRDAKCRAIFLELAQGNGVDGCVWLDCSPVADERLGLHHAGLVKMLRSKGVDFPREWISVAPAAHFLLGGIEVDSRGQTAVPGLFAAGEAAGGVHGANRLAGTAYSEAVVMGHRAGAAATEYVRGMTAGSAGGAAPHLAAGAPQAAAGRVAFASLRIGSREPRPERLIQVWSALKDLMWEHVSLARHAGGLAAAMATVMSLRDEVAEWQGPNPTAAAEVAELAGALLTAEAVIRSAALRTESRGAHYRTDHPEKHDSFCGNVVVRNTSSGLDLTFRAQEPAPPTDRSNAG